MTRPVDPNISIPSAFAINGTKTDFTNEKIQDGFDDTNPDILAGDNLNKFIDDTYKGLNYAMDGVDDLYDVTDDLKDLSNLSASGQAILDNKANKDLSNLSATGEAHFANPDLSNLSTSGDNRLHALKGYLDDGTALTDSEGLADVITYAHSTFDHSKFTVVGTPTITDDGIASEFTNDDYLSKSITLDSTKTFDIHFKFRTPETITTGIIIGNSGSPYPVVNYRINNNKTIMCEFSITSSTRHYTNSTFAVTENTDYFGKISYDKTDVKFYISTDNKNWTTLATLSNITDFTGENTFNEGIGRGIGSTTYAYPFTGTIDLKQFYVLIDGVPVFSGNKTGIDTIKPDDYTVVGTPTISNDGVASGFSSGNYLNAVTVPQATKSYKEYFKFTTPNTFSLTTTTTFILGASDGDHKGFLFGRDANSGKLKTLLGNGSTWVFEQLTSLVLATSTTYYGYVSWDGTDYKVFCGTSNSNLQEVLSYNNISTPPSTFIPRIGNTMQFSGARYWEGSIDLNSFKIYVDGNLVYQPCLKIPYTKSADKYGSKIVDVAYRSRVQDTWEQNFPERYYTLDEANGNFTLPQGEIYGTMLNKSTPHVVETYRNGASWYRVYSDGWCEQGGSVYIPGQDGVPVIFLKSYSNTDYQVMLTNASYVVTIPPGVSPGTKQANGMGLDYGSAEAAGDVYWETKGYIS